ncbi:zinc finger protein 184-like isoform X2 [Rhipicephalus sanguineus]|uniref:zinc finger protein 184-like isoform X2 n=1 Tax=Rhipicephalus sanguineus TaxID=34632 RepID=UPI0020C29E68|nr:zinc finger protein 184-like isoform X2 [Rhipicephalus sanguineus]
MTAIDIKAEPSSPESLLPFELTCVGIKLEPSSPEPMLPFELTCVGIKPEPSSPEPTLPFEDVKTNQTSLDDKALDSSSAESSRDITDIKSGISEGTGESLPEKPRISIGTCPELDICKRNAGDKDCVTSHQATHCNARRRACPICGKFVSPASIAQHQRIHTGEKPHACLVCGQKFAKKSTLFTHSRMHTGEMPYACQVCPSKFCRKDSFDKHMQLHASGVDLHHCPECGKSFKLMIYLRNHLKWHSVEKPYPCLLCPSRFTHKRNLERHVGTHTSEKPHKCPMCEKVYSRYEYLTSHTRKMHDGVWNPMANTDRRVKIKKPRNPASCM